MDTDSFDTLCHVSLGVTAFGILFIIVGMLIRSSFRQEDDLAKWDFLRVAQNVEKHEHCPRPRDERIQSVDDQIQRGDAS